MKGSETYLSSITSLRTFIMATDCSSVKPSPCKRLTNLRVSKWWSREWRVVAWKGRGCRGRRGRNWLVNAGRARMGCQLRRGRRNRGRISVAIVVVVVIVIDGVDGGAETESLRALKCLGRCGERDGWCRPRGLCYVHVGSERQ